jgi:hypothetical protein
VSEPRRRQPRKRPYGEKATLIVTNLIKLGGLVAALNEVMVEPEIRAGGLAIAALMMAGAQSLEAFFTSFFATRDPR